MWRMAEGHVRFPTETLMGTPPPTSEMPQPPPQALHYALANAQQVQIHQIGEDGQVQVVCTFSLARGGELGRHRFPHIAGSHWQLGSRCPHKCHYRAEVVPGTSSNVCRRGHSPVAIPALSCVPSPVPACSRPPSWAASTVGVWSVSSAQTHATLFLLGPAEKWVALARHGASLGLCGMHWVGGQLALQGPTQLPPLLQTLPPGPCGEESRAGTSLGTPPGSAHV